MKKPKITVYTSCYNSEKLIHRVYESLEEQDFGDFEWLCINDCSTDRTSEILDLYKSKASFPVRIFHNTENKHVNFCFDLAIKEAKGEWFLALDHDDALTSNALSGLISAVSEIEDKEDFSGVVALCQDQNGNLIGEKFPYNNWVSDDFKMRYGYKIHGDKMGMKKTSVFREYNFHVPGIRFVPENYVWFRMAKDYKTLYVNEPFKIYYINQSHESLSTLTFKKNEHTEGEFYYYKNGINTYLNKIWLNSKLSAVKYVLRYFQTGLRCDKAFKEIILSIESKWLRFFSPFFLVAAYLLNLLKV